jgi:hypothetical protein
MLGILIFSIFFCIIDVSMLVIPGSIPRMFGMGIPGFPTGEIFNESIVFFDIMLMPQNVKYRCTSMPIAAPVVASIRGGYAMSRLPLEQMMTILFRFSPFFEVGISFVISYERFDADTNWTSFESSLAWWIRTSRMMSQALLMRLSTILYSTVFPARLSTTILR